MREREKEVKVGKVDKRRMFQEGKGQTKKKGKREGLKMIETQVVLVIFKKFQVGNEYRLPRDNS